MIHNLIVIKKLYLKYKKSKSRSVYVDFDIDSKDLTPYTINMMLKPIVGNKAEFYILSTRGGYHILIKPDTVEEKFKKSWYKTMCETFEVDQIGGPNDTYTRYISRGIYTYNI